MPQPNFASHIPITLIPENLDVPLSSSIHVLAPPIPNPYLQGRFPNAQASSSAQQAAPAPTQCILKHPTQFPPVMNARHIAHQNRAILREIEQQAQPLPQQAQPPPPPPPTLPLPTQPLLQQTQPPEPDDFFYQQMVALQQEDEAAAAQAALLVEESIHQQNLPRGRKSYTMTEFTTPD